MNCVTNDALQLTNRSFPMNSSQYKTKKKKSNYWTVYLDFQKAFDKVGEVYECTKSLS